MCSFLVAIGPCFSTITTIGFCTPVGPIQFAMGATASAGNPMDLINICVRPAPKEDEDLKDLILHAAQLASQARSSWGSTKPRTIQVQCAALPPSHEPKAAVEIRTLRAPHSGSDTELRSYDWFGRQSVRTVLLLASVGY